MKNLIFILIFSVILFIYVTSVPHFENAELRHSYRQLDYQGVINADEPCPPGRVGYTTCTPDCRGKSFCTNGVLSNTQLCPDGLPYCNSTTGTCVASIDSCIVRNSSVTSCAQPFTADLQDCRKFTYCNGDGFIYMFYCMINTVFDSSTNNCKSGIPCNNFSNTSICYQMEGQLVAVPGNASQYVLCTNPPQGYICAGNYTFNPALQACQFSCPSEGRFLDVNDKTHSHYYECIVPPGTGVIIAYWQKCPLGTLFDPSGGVNICHFGKWRDNWPHGPGWFDLDMDEWNHGQPWRAKRIL